MRKNENKAEVTLKASIVLKPTTTIALLPTLDGAARSCHRASGLALSRPLTARTAVTAPQVYTPGCAEMGALLPSRKGDVALHVCIPSGVGVFLFTKKCTTKRRKFSASPSDF